MNKLMEFYRTASINTIPYYAMLSSCLPHEIVKWLWH